MGLYSRYIFPWAMDLVLRRREISDLRRQLLSQVRGQILEIGFGTGLNIPYYPSDISQITVVEPNPGMGKKAKQRLQQVPLQVDFHPLKGESLPFPDQSFDCVVSTFTLCSIAGVSQALSEIRRVLKVGGSFYFLEHGLADREKTRRWQRRLTPLQRRFADGCHLDRPIDRLIEGAGLPVVAMRSFYFPKFPKIVGYFYLGQAEKRE